MYWGEFFVAAGAFLAVAVLVGAMVLGHHNYTASIYEKLVEQYNPSRNYLLANDMLVEGNETKLVVSPERVEALLDSAESAAREGARWAGTARCQVGSWALAVLIVAGIVLLYQYWARHGFTFPLIGMILGQ